MKVNKKKQKNSLKNGWKILFKYLFEYKKELVLLSFLGIISALANGTIPYIIGRFFDAILDQSNVFLGTQAEMPLWLFMVVLFGLMQTTSDAVSWLISKKRTLIVLELNSSYKVRGSAYLLKLPISFHKDRKIGSIVERINSAAERLSQIVGSVVIDFTPQFLSMIVGVAISFWINYWLGAILILSMLIYLGILTKILSPIAYIAKKGFTAWHRAHGYLHDTVSNVHTVKGFTTEEYEDKSTNKRFSAARSLLYKAEKIWNGVAFSQRGIITLTRISIFIVAVFLIRSGEITIGELIALTGYAAMVFGPFVTLGDRWHAIQNGIIRIEEAEKILTTPPEVYKPKNAIRIEDVKGNIEFKGVTFHYNKKDGDVLKNINFKVSAGETVALVGESGVGKSTLIDLISAYYFAQKGKVSIDGVDVKKINLKFLRRSIAVVPQEVALFNDAIKTNIKYGNFKASDTQVKKATREAGADVFIEKFPKKYNQLVGERGVKLSVGQKQRVAIARAILRDPKILILDEPTSALDSKSEKYITESLEKLMRGRTTFIIAHRLSTVRKADKILVFKEGRIVESGDHKKLMGIKDGVYKNLYNLHIGLQ